MPLMSNSKKIKKLGGNGQLSQPTHRELGEEFLEIGDDIRHLSTKLSKRPTKKDRFKISPGPGYSPGKVGLLLRDGAKVKAKGKFGKSYRSIQTEQDELVSTSSIRELMAGVLTSGVLSANELAVMEEAFEEMSKLRFPTRFTGFALKDEVVQHPTAKGTGLFAESSQTMKAHNRLDLERRAEVAKTMSVALQEKGATVQSVARAGMRAAIAFSLNEFIAPVTARDVQPFAQGIKGKRIALLREQVQARENLKAILVMLGGKQDSGPVDLTRKWSIRRGQRSASPRRLPKSTPFSVLAPRPV